jgi:hypothetical protein
MISYAGSLQTHAALPHHATHLSFPLYIGLHRTIAHPCFSLQLVLTRTAPATKCQPAHTHPSPPGLLALLRASNENVVYGNMDQLDDVANNSWTDINTRWPSSAHSRTDP